MSRLRLTFTRVFGPCENYVNDHAEHLEIANSIETIVEETGCTMEWDDPSSYESSVDRWSIGWLFSFRNENQEECARSMLEDLVRDYPNLLTLTDF